MYRTMAMRLSALGDTAKNDSKFYYNLTALKLHPPCFKISDTSPV